MEILIAMNSFKGSLSAIDASEIVEKAALELGFNKTRIFKVPIVDGGTDSLEVWSNFLDLEPIAINTVNPLGKPITTTILFNKDSGTAYIEMAKASGVH